MGRIFYGSPSNKDLAMKIANAAANAYIAGVCYTPSFRIPNSCTFNQTNGIWTYQAHPHHHWGSCDSGTFTSSHQRANGTPWGPITVPIPIPDILDKTKDNIQTDKEEYIDAFPEEYFSY
ncbi:hypothetical protein V2E39_23650 [Chryseobacterium arthrosphaerae]|uniref:Uncharacterized protein n=1 Tax=Chryseobacterium arthrosphaerae TaxID=651561 RepID=A0ABU7R6N8_9FLAO|nr:hypothetical protein [Chryseobacterium arthrosphaerae]